MHRVFTGMNKLLDQDLFIILFPDNVLKWEWDILDVGREIATARKIFCCKTTYKVIDACIDCFVSGANYTDTNAMLQAFTTDDVIGDWCDDNGLTLFTSRTSEGREYYVSNESSLALKHIALTRFTPTLALLDFYNNL
jgi:hypothetical protein